MRAIEPATAGYVERDGVKLYWELFGDGRADHRAPADVVDHPLAVLEGPGAVPRPPLPGGDVRRPGHGSFRPARRSRTPTATSSSPPTRSPCSMPRTPTEAVLVGLSCGALWGVQVAADRPDRVRGLVCLAPAGSARARRIPIARCTRSPSGWTPPTGGRSTTATTGSRAATADFLEFFVRQVLHRAALDQADRGLRRVGPRDRTGARWSPATKGSDACGLESFRSVCERIARAGAGDPRRRRRTRAPRQRAPHWRRSPGASWSRSPAAVTFSRLATRFSSTGSSSGSSTGSRR